MHFEGYWVLIAYNLKATFLYRRLIAIIMTQVTIIRCGG